MISPHFFCTPSSLLVLGVGSHSHLIEPSCRASLWSSQGHYDGVFSLCPLQRYCVHTVDVGVQGMMVQIYLGQMLSID